MSKQTVVNPPLPIPRRLALIYLDPRLTEEYETGHGSDRLALSILRFPPPLYIRYPMKFIEGYFLISELQVRNKLAYVATKQISRETRLIEAVSVSI